MKRFLDERKERDHLIKDDVDTRSLALLIISVYEGLKVAMIAGTEESRVEGSWRLFVQAMLTSVLRTG